MKFLTVSSILAISLLVGCNKKSGDSAVDADGNCTQQTIDAFNELGRNAKYGSLQSTLNSCNQVKSLLGDGRSCKAYSFEQSSDVYVSYSEISSTCERLRLSLQSSQQSPRQNEIPKSEELKIETKVIPDCTNLDISTINRLSIAAQDFKSNPDYYSLLELRNRCRDISNTDLKKNLKCNAVNTRTQEAKLLEYSTYETACDRILNSN